MFDYTDTYTADDFDLEAEFRAALNYDDEFDTESEWTRDSGFMTDDEVHGLQVKHAKRARQELERLMSTDNANRDAIAAIINSNPDVDYDKRHGHEVGSYDLEEDERRASANLDDEDTKTVFDRFNGHTLYFVSDNAAWRSGFNPAKFANHVEASAKARRYHGIEDIVLDGYGRVKGRHANRPKRRQARVRGAARRQA